MATLSVTVLVMESESKWGTQLATASAIASASRLVTLSVTVSGSRLEIPLETASGTRLAMVSGMGLATQSANM